MKSPDVHVAITGFGGLHNPDSGAAVARTLREGWDGLISIDALGYDCMMTGAWMRGVADHLHLLPQPFAGDALVLQRIREINAKRQLDVLIPCLDSDVIVFSRVQEQLAAEGIHTLLPGHDSILGLIKSRLPAFFFERGVPAAMTYHVADITDLPRFADQLGYPLTVMGTISDAVTANAVDEAMRAAEWLHGKWGDGVVLQQVLTGDEFSVAALAGAGSDCRGLVAMRKLATNEAGLVECGTVVADPHFESLVSDVLGQLEWRGPLELEFVRPQGALEPLLKNIHYRFPAWITLSEFANCNLPARLVEEALRPGQGRTDGAEPGTMFIRGIDEVAVPLENLLSLKSSGNANGMGLNGAHHDVMGNIEIDGPKAGIRVAVTGTSTFDLINPGLGVARALREVPSVTAIYGLTYGTFDSGAFQRELFDAAFRLPISEEPRDLLARIEEVHASHPFDVLLPCLDGELPLFIAIREQIEALGVRVLLPTQDAFDRRSKPILFDNKVEEDFGGFRIPQGFIASGEAEVVRAAETIGLPVVIKGPMSGCCHVFSVDDARSAWRQLNGYGIRQVIVQNRIEGEIYAVAGVCDRQHRNLSTLSIKKLALCDRGSTWSGLQIRAPVLEEAFGNFLEGIKWVGPVEGEFVRDYIDDRFYLFEVNPRFTGWIAYSGAVGENHPEVAIRAALGTSLSVLNKRAELVFMRSVNDLSVSTVDMASLSINGSILDK